MKSARFGRLGIQARRASRQSDCPLDERPQLLGLRQGGDDALVPRVNQRSGQVAQHRHAMFRCASKLSMCLEMSHGYLLLRGGFKFVVLGFDRAAATGSRNWITFFIELHTEVEVHTAQNVANLSQ